ncbi:MAG: IclR family transcriptional regulator [Chloroflexi bacterium OHK40]
MTNDYIVKPVYKALQVLLCLGEERREMALSEICYRVAMPKTTTFRYLQTLCACGFVTHDPGTDLYRIGLRLWAIGQLAREPLHLRETALPAMRELRDRFNETVNLGILDGRDIVYLDMVESRRSLRMQAQLGGRDPVYSTALGKAMVAFLPEDRWPEHLPTRLTPRTDASHTTLASLRDDLRRTRERGYGLDDGENEEGVRCVGAPIFDQDGHVAAGVSLSAPAARMNDRALPEAAASVIQTALAISCRLGYRPR